jgi:hypothetical protein
VAPPPVTSVPLWDSSRFTGGNRGVLDTESDRDHHRLATTVDSLHSVWIWRLIGKCYVLLVSVGYCWLVLDTVGQC